MSAEARELNRIIRVSVREMLNVYRIQAKAGPVTDRALEQIVFRAAHPIVNSLAPYSAEHQAALMPSIVRMLLAAFLERVEKRGITK